MSYLSDDIHPVDAPLREHEVGEEAGDDDGNEGTEVRRHAKHPTTTVRRDHRVRL